MNIDENAARSVNVIKAQQGLNNMAVLSSILTLVDQVSVRLSKEEATCSGMTREATQSICLKRIEERLALTRG